MDLRILVLCFACVVLLSTTGVYGYKFLKKRNYLLGLEWMVVAFSATNFLIYFLSGSEVAYYLSYFCDVFTRGFGFPIIATLGLMAVTHGYKPSALMDVGLFGLAIAGTFFLILAEFMVELLPYLYVGMWTLFSIYLAIFAKKLLSARKGGHALVVVLALLSSQAIAYVYEFYKIPGDETNIVLNFYFLALMTWSFTAVALYYAYCALERVNAVAAPTARAMKGRTMVSEPN